MGLQWSEPAKVSKNSKGLVKSPMSADLWAEWKTHKEGLKKDGFTIRKNERTNEWEVQYWVNLTEDNQKKISGREKWMVDFEKHCLKWEKRFSS